MNLLGQGVVRQGVCDAPAGPFPGGSGSGGHVHWPISRPTLLPCPISGFAPPTSLLVLIVPRAVFLGLQSIARLIG